MYLGTQWTPQNGVSFQFQLFESHIRTDQSCVCVLEGVFDLSLASPLADKLESSVQFDDLVIPGHIKEIVKNLTTHHLKHVASTRVHDKGSTTIKEGGI